MNKTLSAIIAILFVGAIVFSFYYFYTQKQTEEAPELTNALLLRFPGSQSVFYKDYFKNNDDSRLDQFEIVIDYASRNGEEVALVKSDVNAIGTFVLIANNNDSFTQLHVADGGEKRMVDISPTGNYIAYSYFVGNLEEGLTYGNVDDWQTRIVNTESGYIEREIPGYAPQFVTDSTILVGTSGGVLLYDMNSKRFAESGLRFRTPVGMIPFRVNADSSEMVVLDLNANMYHVLSINSINPFTLTYQSRLSIDEGTVMGAKENAIFFVSKFENEDFLVSERNFSNILVTNPLYQVKNI